VTKTNTVTFVAVVGSSGTETRENVEIYINEPWVARDPPDNLILSLSGDWLRSNEGSDNQKKKIKYEQGRTPIHIDGEGT